MSSDKFIKVPTDMLEAMYSARFTGGQYKAIMYIIRKTYGWNKTKDKISVTRMAAETGVSKRAMINIVNQLEELNVLKVEKTTAGKPNILSLKPVKQWTPVKYSSPVKRSSPQGVKRSSPLPVKHSSPTKDIYKDNIQKTIAPPEPGGWIEDFDEDDEEGKYTI